MATLEQTFQTFLDQLNTMITSAATAGDLSVLQQQLERISALIQDGANLDPDYIALIPTAVQNTRKINGMSLDQDINLDYSDVSAMRNDFYRGFGRNVYGTEELDDHVVSNDLDDILHNSRYNFYDALNAPIPTWGFVDTMVHHDPNFAVQVVVGMTENGFFYRRRHSGIWDPWIRLSEVSNA